MKYRWIESIEEFEAVAGDWDKALSASANHNPFLLSDFITTWWRHFRDGLRLRIFVIYEEKGIVGGIPLYIRRGNGVYRFADILSYIGASAANYTEPFYGRPDVVFFSCIKEALSSKRDWDILYLPEVSKESPLVSECNASLSDGRFLIRLIQDHMNMGIDLSRGGETYLSALPGKLRRDLRSKRRSLTKDYGEIVLKEIRGEDEIGRYFDIYCAFSLSSFSARRRKSSFEDERYRVFFREFLIRMGQRDRLDAHALMAGDKVLAVSFGYKLGKGFNWVLTAFDYEFRHFRPGYLLIEELIKEISRRGDTYYNWYGYDRFYKDQWCDKRTPLYRIFLIRRTFKGICYDRIKNVENLLRTNKALIGLARRLKRV